VKVGRQIAAPVILVTVAWTTAWWYVNIGLIFDPYKPGGTPRMKRRDFMALLLAGSLVALAPDAQAKDDKENKGNKGGSSADHRKDEENKKKGQTKEKKEKKDKAEKKEKKEKKDKGDKEKKSK
jgi:hypothetical protein